MKLNKSKSEFLFYTFLYISGVLIILLVGGIFFTLFVHSLPSIKELGINFLIGTTWDPIAENFGSLPFLIGTLLTSFLAIIISFPFSLSLSILLGEYFKEGSFSRIIKSMIELLAGIPSVIYGFWGLFFLIPIIRKIEIFLGIPPYGVGIFSASSILSIMVIPYSASIGQEVINLIPSEYKEAAYSLGATRYEVVRYIIIPYAKSGIIAGILLSLGRALGETMAVTMVIGNSNYIPKSIFSPGNTIASVIANEFTEAVQSLHISSLIEIGLLLFIVTTIINLTGKYIIKKLSI